MIPSPCKHSWKQGPVAGTNAGWRCTLCHSIRFEPPSKTRLLVIAEEPAPPSQEPRQPVFIAPEGQCTTPSLCDAAEATLLFHNASPWTEEKRRRWQMLTGTEEATTRNLCDTCRKALQQEGGGR